MTQQLAEMAFEATKQLEKNLVSTDQKNSPEWRAVQDALHQGQLRVACVGLEVFASHFNKQLPSTTKKLLQALAESLRCSKLGKTKALITLLAYRSQAWAHHAA